MQCELCGGEINLSVGRCVKCGHSIDETSDIRRVHDIEELAVMYGIKSEEQIAEEQEELPELLRTDTFKKVKKEAEDISKGFVNADGPRLGLVDYDRLLFEENDSSEPNFDEPFDKYAHAAPKKENKVLAEKLSPIKNAADKVTEKIAACWGIVKSAFMNVAGKAAGKINPYTDKLLEKYHERIPELKRARRSPLLQRILMTAAVVAAAVAVIFVIAAISNSIAPGVKGEWLITQTGSGERLTWEFTGSGKVIVRTYVDGNEHIYKSGTYKKQRRNDHNMLTITYEDGSSTRLYYEIKHRVGTFTNVDSNQTAQYKRVH